MRDYSGDIHFVCLEDQPLAKKQSSFKVYFITQLRRRYYLATRVHIAIPASKNQF